MERSTTLTCWIKPEGSVQAFRATLHRNVELTIGGKVVIFPALWRMARGAVPCFNPETAAYATSDMVDNIVANGHIRVDGDTASASRLTSVAHAWKQWVPLPVMLEHAYLGKTAPTQDVIVASYTSYAAASAVEA